MERDQELQAPVDLGRATDKTLGGKGEPFDLVKDIPAAHGIADD